MTRPYILEICCYTIQSCEVAVASGADRIELCADPAQGGTTPSYGLIRAARERCPVPLFPIIRSRGGDFLYDRDDLEQMLSDVQICRELGCDGLVIGALTQEGSIDKSLCGRLVEAAGSLRVSFHRAFDRARDPMEALETVIGLGCERVLTSGQHPEAAEGASLIARLVRQAGDRITIMPGSGVRSSNVSELAKTTGAREFHTSAGVHLPSMMQFLQKDMREQLTTVAVNSDEVRQIKKLLQAL